MKDFDEFIKSLNEEKIVDYYEKYAPAKFEATLNSIDGSITFNAESFKNAVMKISSRTAIVLLQAYHDWANSQE